MKILLVEDERDLAEVLDTFLESEGFEVHIVATSIEAVDFLKVEKFDVVISDYSMPEMNGVELYICMVNQLCQEIPFIIFTGMDYDKVEVPAGAKIQLIFKTGEAITNLINAVKGIKDS